MTVIMDTADTRNEIFLWYLVVYNTETPASQYLSDKRYITKWKWLLELIYISIYNIFICIYTVYLQYINGSLSQQ